MIQTIDCTTAFSKCNSFDTDSNRIAAPVCLIPIDLGAYEILRSVINDASNAMLAMREPLEHLKQQSFYAFDLIAH